VEEDVWWMNDGGGQVLTVAKVLGGYPDAMATPRCATL
jgi:hypothetical protein